MCTFDAVLPVYFSNGMAIGSVSFHRVIAYDGSAQR